MSRRKSLAAGAAVAGGAGLLAWLLLRRGSGLGLGGGAKGVGGACRVLVDRGNLRLDDRSTDLASAIAACRAAGRAEVTASGAAVVGVVAELLYKLQAAGVDVQADPELWRLAALRPVEALE